MNTKNYISNIVKECIDDIKTDMLRESIRPIIAESVMEEKKKGGKIKIDDLVDKLMKNPKFKKKAIQYLNDEDAYNGWSENLKGKSYSTLDNQSDGSKRRTVTQRLKDKKIDYAPIAYELWPNMSPDAARSWFSKKVDGKNEKFSDEEVSKIYNLLNNVMTENKKR